MKEALWRLAARTVARPAVRDYLIRRAMRTPYTPIIKDGEVYMERYWLFNRFDTPAGQKSRFPWSIQLHKILLEDRDRHPHDHPWWFRTLIMDGWYAEERVVHVVNEWDDYWTFKRKTLHAGDTASINFNEFHRVSAVSTGGVWTVFITGPYQGTWGFLVDGVKVKYRKYLGLD